MLAVSDALSPCSWLQHHTQSGCWDRYVSESSGTRASGVAWTQSLHRVCVIVRLSVCMHALQCRWPSHKEVYRGLHHKLGADALVFSSVSFAPGLSVPRQAVGADNHTCVLCLAPARCSVKHCLWGAARVALCSMYMSAAAAAAVMHPTTTILPEYDRCCGC